MGRAMSQGYLNMRQSQPFPFNFDETGPAGFLSSSCALFSGHAGTVVNPLRANSTTVFSGIPGKAHKWPPGSRPDRFLWTLARLCILLAAVMLLGCVESGTNTDQSPALSNMAILGDKLYVSYLSPDPLVKFDTIWISFNYNASKVKSIDIWATLDSEKTWISLGGVFPNNSKKASFEWVPKNYPTAFNYCGKKEAFIRVRDTSSNEHIDSDPFLIVGRVPYVLSSPKRKETFSITDTIQILYTQNQGHRADISVSAKGKNDLPDVHGTST